MNIRIISRLPAEVQIMQALGRHVIIHTPDEDGFWVITCPSLPGCTTHGTSREEAIENIREAIELYIESLEAYGEPIPISSER